MRYFISFVWNPEDKTVSSAARKLIQKLEASSPLHPWQRALSEGGLAVWHRCDERYSVDGLYRIPHGLVFGKLFDGQQPVQSIDDGAAQAIIASGGRELLRRYWGQYVAFTWDPDQRVARVLRDPTAAVPCQWMRINGVDVYFVRLEDCAPLHAASYSINHHYIRGYLLYDAACVRETGLREVETVLAGECIEHAYGIRKHSFYWNPLQFCGDNVVEDPAEAASMLRETVSTVVSTWGACFDKILLRLSGGLDSSVVAACLAGGPSRPDILCVNEFQANGSADERRFARIAAGHAGLPLQEVEGKREFALSPIGEVTKAPFPFPIVGDPEVHRTRVEFAKSHDLSVNFSGFGGDEIFHRGGMLPTAVDYAYRHGLRPSLFQVAIDDAVCSRSSVWPVLQSAYRFGIAKKPWSIRSAVRPFRPLMKADVKVAGRNDPTHWHPLFRDHIALPPCKVAHAFSLTFHTSRAYTPGALPGAPVEVASLSSQPLIELALRIPVYVLQSGGRDRSLVRTAFADRLPPEILRRKSKGYMDIQLTAILSKNQRWIREALLDGYLVREGYLDREKVESILAGKLTGLETNSVEILDYLNVELWASSGWCTTPQLPQAINA